LLRLVTQHIKGGGIPFDTKTSWRSKSCHAVLFTSLELLKMNDITSAKERCGRWLYPQPPTLMWRRGDTDGCGCGRPLSLTRRVIPSPLTFEKLSSHSHQSNSKSKCREAEDSSKLPSCYSGLALPHWVFTSKYPTRSTCLCYPWLVSRLFMHDLRESTLHHSLCCGLIESRNIHDEYCIKQAILTEVSTSIKDLRARGLHGWEHQSRLTPRMFFLEGMRCHQELIPATC
jgi:hypothetical protein